MLPDQLRPDFLSCYGADFIDTPNIDWIANNGTRYDRAYSASPVCVPARTALLTGMNAIHGYQGRAPVSAAKHGLWGLTKALAKEFGARGITVNAISPGPIRSEHTDPELTRHIEQQVTRIPVGHLGEPSHIASLCGYLASDDGSFVSGQMIGCNGAAET